MTGFPRTVEAITPQWLTQVLRAQGVLGSASVTGFEATPLGVGVGFMSAMRRLNLTYDGPAPGAPTSLIVKLAPVDPGARQIDQAFHFYEKETGFYREIGPASPIRSPRAWHVGFDPESHDFVLLLEDLAPARVGDQVDGLSPQDAARAIGSVAGLHARWWNDPSLPDRTWLLRMDSAQTKSLEPIYQQCWPAVVDFLGDRLSPKMKALGERLAPRVAQMLDMANARPCTVIHGDYRADNMFFDHGPDAEPFAVADWQVMLQGCGAFDVAYMLTGSMDVDLRRRHERELVGGYHTALVEGGVSGYGADEAWEDYRLCAMLGWCWPVVAIGSLDMANERGVAMFHAWTDRSMSAVMDLEAGDLLPA